MTLSEHSYTLSGYDLISETDPHATLKWFYEKNKNYLELNEMPGVSFQNESKKLVVDHVEFDAIRVQNMDQGSYIRYEIVCSSCSMLCSFNYLLGWTGLIDLL